MKTLLRLFFSSVILLPGAVASADDDLGVASLNFATAVQSRSLSIVHRPAFEELARLSASNFSSPQTIGRSELSIGVLDLDNEYGVEIVGQSADGVIIFVKIIDPKFSAQLGLEENVVKNKIIGFHRGLVKIPLSAQEVQSRSRTRNVRPYQGPVLAVDYSRPGLAEFAFHERYLWGYFSGRRFGQIEMLYTSPSAGVPMSSDPLELMRHYNFRWEAVDRLDRRLPLPEFPAADHPDIGKQILGPSGPRGSQRNILRVYPQNGWVAIGGFSASDIDSKYAWIAAHSLVGVSIPEEFPANIVAKQSSRSSETYRVVGVYRNGNVLVEERQGLTGEDRIFNEYAEVSSNGTRLSREALRRLYLDVRDFAELSIPRPPPGAPAVACQERVTPQPEGPRDIGDVIRGIVNTLGIPL